MRLIDADALTMCHYDLEGTFPFNAVPEETLEAAPTIDAVEQKHGHWEDYTYNAPDGLIYYVKKCSCCGLMASEAFAQESKFCKDCGAKMDEVTE